MSGSNWRGSIVQLIALTFLIAMMENTPRSIQMLLTVAAFTVTFGIQFYCRLFSSRIPQDQLWLCPAGIVQIPSTREARQAQLLLHSLYWPFFFLIILFPLFQQHPFSIAVFVTVALMLATGTGVYWCWCERRYRGFVSAQTPSLWSWKRVEVLEFESLSQDRARIRCKAKRYWRRMLLSENWIVDIEIYCPQSIAPHLHEQLLTWRQQHALQQSIFRLGGPPSQN